MGGACCVAARERTLTSRTNNEAFHRNIRYSPSWSFRWDNRGRVAGEVEDTPHQYCHGMSGNIGLEIKSQTNLEMDVSDGGSPLENFPMNKWRKSSIHDGTAGNLTTPASGKFFVVSLVLFLNIHLLYHVKRFAGSGLQLILTILYLLFRFFMRSIVFFPFLSA